MSDDLFNIIYNKSLDLLSRREHSFKEIKEKLSARFENKEIIESVIEKLSDNNLVNNTRFAEAYVSARKRIDNYAMDKYFDYQVRSKIHAQFRKDKVVTVTNSTGYDEIYLLAGDNMQVQDGQMATPSENAKKGEIKRLFTSTLKGNKQSRVMLNKFISKVA